MERARATWTDERLDDLVRNVERRFDGVDARFDRIDARFDHLEARFDAMNGRFDALQRMMIQFSGATTIAILATLVSVIVTRG
jgi:hypothetical protein